MLGNENFVEHIHNVEDATFCIWNSSKKTVYKLRIFGFLHSAYVEFWNKNILLQTEQNQHSAVFILDNHRFIL